MCQSAEVQVIADNERVRILRYTLASGAETGWRTHASDYVIVPYADCRVRVDSAAGPVTAEMRRDDPYFRPKGVTHNVTSLMDEPFSFLEIEIK